MNRLILSRLIVVLLACLLSTVAGCGFMQSKTDAEKVLARHFQTIATNGYNTAMMDYGSLFFEKTTKNEWTTTLEKLNARLGTYQSHSIASWRVFKNAGATGAGTTVSLQCQVTYSKHSATESFTLVRGLTDPDYKIVGHFINSTALLTE